MPTLNEQLARWIAEGGCRLGQVAIRAALPPAPGFRLTHLDDQEKAVEELCELAGLPAIREWTRYDEAGGLRPLKTSPDLRPGWHVEAPDIPALREVLECLYPGMVAAYFAHRGGLAATPVRETLGRQTGMYRFARTLSDPGLERLVGECCGGHACLKRVLWPRTGEQPLEVFDARKKSAEAPLGEMPLLCFEACFQLVAAARLAAKAESEARETAPA